MLRPDIDLIRRRVEIASTMDVLTLIAYIEQLEYWEDKKDAWSSLIHDAFPTRSGSHDAYAKALEMVSNRHSKGALVALVNWLLVEIDNARNDVTEVRKSWEEICEKTRVMIELSTAAVEAFGWILETQAVKVIHDRADEALRAIMSKAEGAGIRLAKRQPEKTEWLLCTEHEIIVREGVCRLCDGDRYLVRVRPTTDKECRDPP